MFINNLKFSARHFYVSLFLAIGLPPINAAPQVPWWKTSTALNWRPFDALPAIGTTNGASWHWEILERSDGSMPRFFAQIIASRGYPPPRLFAAGASANPKFAEITGTNMDWNVTSVALAKWNGQYDSLFLGTDKGLLYLNEDRNMLFTIWGWSWDPTYIVSVGNGIIGTVVNCGSESGLHYWGPYTHSVIYRGCAGSYIWADPIYGKYGNGQIITRMLTPDRSVEIDPGYDGGAVSTDGGKSFRRPVGFRPDGIVLYVGDFYPYDEKTFIIESYSYGGSMFIGHLGERLESIAAPLAFIDTFFYSPSTRLLVAGNHKEGLYSATLPASETGPNLRITSLRGSVTIKWNAQYSLRRLESSPFVTGPWQSVNALKQIVGSQARVTLPASGTAQFFRLVGQ